MNNSEFQGELKSVEVTTIFKKDDPTKSKTCRSTSVLPTVSKVFKRIMDKQMSFIAEKSIPLYVWLQKRFSVHNKPYCL